MNQIGWLLMPYVLCLDCGNKRWHDYQGEHAAPLFDENIGSYAQACHICGKCIHCPQKGWPQLFNKPTVPLGSVVALAGVGS